MSSGTIGQRRRQIWLTCFWIAVAIATAFCAFVLPFYFPRNQPVLSASYSAGDNNRVAAIAVAAIMLLVLFVCWKLRIGSVARTQVAQPQVAETHPRPQPADRNPSLRLRWLAWAIVAALVFTGGLGWLVARAHVFWGDAGYFINRLTAGLIFHRPIYTGFEFSYGRLLYAWPAAFVRALVPLGMSMTGAYLVSLAAIQALGLALLFYVIQALPMRRSLKAAALVLFTFGFLTPLLGINYSVFRFVLPFAGIVWVARRQSFAAATGAAVIAQIVELACSPEMGMAFGAAIAIYGLYRALVSGWRWLLVSAAAALMTFVGRGSLLTMAKFAQGEFNLIIEPLPHMLVFLIAATALAPLAVAIALRKGGRDAGMLLSMFVASIGLLPVALGRCDPIHVLCNGLGLYLLSFVAITSATPPWRKTWVVAVGLIVLLTQVVNFSTYKSSFGAVLRRTPDKGDADIDVARLETAIGTASVAVPIYAPETVVDDLIQSGQYRPGYYSGLGWDSAAERRTIDDMRGAQFALIPNGPLRFTEDIDNTRIKRLMRFGYVYRQRREPFVVGYQIAAELAQHWQPVGRFGNFTLYHRIS